MNLYVFMLFLDTVAYSGLIVRNGMFQSVCLSVCLSLLRLASQYSSYSYIQSTGRFFNVAAIPPQILHFFYFLCILLVF